METAMLMSVPLGWTTIWLPRVCLNLPGLFDGTRAAPKLRPAVGCCARRIVGPGKIADRIRKRLQPVPNGVDEVAVGRIGGQRVLVIEHKRFVGGGEGDRRVPVHAAINRAACEHGVRSKAAGFRVLVEGEDERVQGAIRARTKATGRTRAGSRPPVTQRGAGQLHKPPNSRRRRSSHRRHRHASPAVVPAVLLPDADDVAGVDGIDDDPRLDFRVGENG